MSASQSMRKRPRKSIFCKHCNQYVSHPTYYRHKAKFYDATNDKWIQEVSASDSDSEVDLQIYRRQDSSTSDHLQSRLPSEPEFASENDHEGEIGNH